MPARSEVLIWQKQRCVIDAMLPLSKGIAIRKEIVFRTMQRSKI
jgi:hypothetical protein